MRSTLPLRGERFRCGCPKTLDNVTYRRKHRDEPYAPCCKTCEWAYQATAWQKRKRTRQPVQWISAPREVIESCRSAFLAATQAKKPTGRPRKPLNVRTAA